MVRRLNLAKYHCERIEVWSHLNLSYPLVKRLITLSYGKANKEGVPMSAIYGGIYTIGKIPHVMRGIVQIVKPGEGYGEYHVGLIDAKGKWPRPPKEIKPISLLMDVIKDEAQESNFWCYIDFVYPDGSGWRSTIEFPQPMQMESEQQRGFTHFEGIELSKRVQDEVEYSVRAESQRGRLSHRVYFLYKGGVSEEMFRIILDKAAQISRLLLVPQ